MTHRGRAVAVLAAFLVLAACGDSNSTSSTNGWICTAELFDESSLHLPIIPEKGFTAGITDTADQAEDACENSYEDAANSENSSLATPGKNPNYEAQCSCQQVTTIPTGNHEPTPTAP